MTDPNDELVPLRTAHHEQSKLSDLGYLLSKPADGALNPITPVAPVSFFLAPRALVPCAEN